MRTRIVAEGLADIYPRLSPTCEWDTAAGHAVLLAAGGRFDGLDGEPLQGQLAVAKVVINRAASGLYPTSWCGVVKQRSQFGRRLAEFQAGDPAPLSWVSGKVRFSPDGRWLGDRGLRTAAPGSAPGVSGAQVAVLPAARVWIAVPEMRRLA